MAGPGDRPAKGLEWSADVILDPSTLIILDLRLSMHTVVGSFTNQLSVIKFQRSCWAIWAAKSW